MFKQLTKILQEKCPKLRIEYSHAFCRIYIYDTDNYRIMTICEDKILCHTKTKSYYVIKPNDPEYLQTIDKLLSDSRLNDDRSLAFQFRRS